jgi:hypothetical protein
MVSWKTFWKADARGSLRKNRQFWCVVKPTSGWKITVNAAACRSSRIRARDQECIAFHSLKHPFERGPRAGHTFVTVPEGLFGFAEVQRSMEARGSVCKALDPRLATRLTAERRLGGPAITS